MTKEEIRDANYEIQTKLNHALFVLECFKASCGDGDLLYDIVKPWIQDAYDLSECTLSELERIVDK